jgi:t-SNARE complex subunit (syntaxin)
VALSDTEKAKKAEIDTQVAEYEKLMADVKLIEDKTKEIQNIRKVDVKEAANNKRQQNQKNVDDAVSFGLAKAQGISRTFKALKEENNAFIAEETKKNGSSGQSSRAQIRLNLHNTYLKKYMAVLNNFNTVRQEFKNYRDKRDVNMLITHGYSESDASTIVEEGGNSQELLKKALASEALQSVVNDMKGRQEMIQSIERQAKELLQMFQDLATLVDLQGETLNLIEERIGQAKDHVEKGKTEIETASDYQEKNRGCLCWLILIAAVVLCAVLFPLLASQGVI